MLTDREVKNKILELVEEYFEGTYDNFVKIISDLNIEDYRQIESIVRAFRAEINNLRDQNYIANRNE